MKKILYLVLIVTASAASGVLAQKPATREVSSEAAVTKGSTVRIVGANRKLSIKSWDQAKVKVTVLVKQDSSLTSVSDQNLFEALGIAIKPFSNRVEILANRSTNLSSLNAITVTGYGKKKVPGPTAEERLATQRAAEMVYAEDLLASTTTTNGLTRTPGQNLYVYDDNRLRSYGKVAEIMSLEIMVPAGSKLDVNNQYGDVMIGMNLDEAKLDVSNGSLELQDVKNLELVGKYCNANFGNIEKAEIEFQNGTLHAQSINDLDLDSKYSTIEYEKGKDLYIRSQADNITIDEITKVDGRKTYGSIRVDMLNGNFDLDGVNVDIKIRNINPQVEMIKINNKYGDVRLPVKNLKNYFVDFAGYYSNVFTPFQKTVIKEEEKKDADPRTENELVDMAIAGQYYRSSAAVTGELAPKRFTGTVGDVSGKHTRFQLTCHSCTVDFK